MTNPRHLVLALAVAAPLHLACTNTAPSTTEAVTSDSQASDDSANSGERLRLGPISDDDMRKMIHSELEKRVTKTASVGDGAEESTELGDGETFQYTVVKLSRGLDDVSGDPSETPDGADIEVNGWYKRSLNQKDAKEPEVNCKAFDTVTHLVKKAGKWQVPDDYQVVFNHEDSEDCY